MKQQTSLMQNKAQQTQRQKARVTSTSTAPSKNSYGKWVVIGSIAGLGSISSIPIVSLLFTK